MQLQMQQERLRDDFMVKSTYCVIIKTGIQVSALSDTPMPSLHLQSPEGARDRRITGTCQKRNMSTNPGKFLSQRHSWRMVEENIRHPLLVSVYRHKYVCLHSQRHTYTKQMNEFFKVLGNDRILGKAQLVCNGSGGSP